MAGDKVSTAVKPVMRGLLHANIKKNLGVAIVLAAVSAVAVKTLYGNTRKQLYAEYYKTYDPEAHFERMKDAGLMQSVAP